MTIHNSFKIILGDSMKTGYNLTTRYEELRLDCELKQGDIANVLNVKRNTYSKWENCINDMPLDKSNDLANYYQTSLDYLLGLSHIRNFIPEHNKINYKILSERLLELRKDAKLTQEELSNKLGFLQRTYAYYESGERVPTTLKLLVIAQYYDVSSDYLVGRSNIKEIRVNQ